jgi:hypothetical protein
MALYIGSPLVDADLPSKRSSFDALRLRVSDSEYSE